jgi:hypothetical protein
MHLIYHSSHGKFLKAGNSQNRLCWIRTTSQVAGPSTNKIKKTKEKEKEKELK